MKNILVTICARGGSQGIPKKNIKKINGVPLIAFSINMAQSISKKWNTDIALSSDDKEIISIAEEYGIKTEYIRPAHLASSTSGKIDVLKNILSYTKERKQKEYDYIIDLDVTSPLRTLIDIENAFNLLQESDAYNIFSVSKANRNPYFNMVEKNDNGFVSLVKSNDSFLTRQDAPEVYDMNASFYIYRNIFFEMDIKTSVSEKSLAYVMNHICFDIDEPIDFQIMEFLISNNHLGFEL